MSGLTAGAIKKIHTETIADGEFRPVMQVVNLKLMQVAGEGTERCRLMLSDGEYTVNGAFYFVVHSIIIRTHNSKFDAAHS